MKSRSSFRKRAFWRTSWSLALGALTTAVIAMSLAFWGHHPAAEESELVANIRTQSNVGDFHPITKGTYEKLCGVSAVSFSVNMGMEGCFGGPSDSSSDEAHFVSALPIWARSLVADPLHSNRIGWSWLAEAHGWPFRALYYVTVEVGRPGEQPPKVVGGYVVRNNAGIRTLPYTPIWYGFLLDTLLFASIWWLLLFLPRQIIDLQRYRRGVCPMCAYDLRRDYSHGCNECGWRRVD